MFSNFGKFIALAAIVFGLTASAPLQAQSIPVLAYGRLPFTPSNTAVDTATLVPLQVVGLLVGTPTGAAAYTTPTAAQICAAFTFKGRNGFNWDLYVKNTSGGSNTITWTAGSGVAVTGTATIAQNAVKHFMGRLNNCTTGSESVTFTSLGTSVF